MKKNRYHYFLFIVFIFCWFDQSSIAQDSLSVHALIKQVEDQQLRQDPFFMPGVFPSYISNKKIYREKRKDNNVFYTALISYTLKTLRSELPATDQTIVDSIVARSERAVAQFKNRKGRETYNFWRTDSAYRLPYLWGLNYTKKGILEDDPDCTSICLLSLNVTSATAKNAHAVMQDYINDSNDPTRTTFTRYKPYGAYSTWMGKRLPVVLDVCVLTNVLSFVQTYDLAWTKADSASLELIVATLNYKDHIANPYIVAPYYGGTSVILYHLARLMSIKTLPALENIKDILINDALKQLQQTDDEFEKIILSSALMKWQSTAALPGQSKPTQIEKSDHPFFIGNIPSIFNFALKKPLSKKKIGFYYHYCPAYNNVLLIEYLVLKNKTGTPGFTQTHF